MCSWKMMQKNRMALTLLLMVATLCGVAIAGEKQQQLVGSQQDSQDSMMKLSSYIDSSLRYDAPDDCRFSVYGNDDVSLSCNLRTINSEFDTTNFSVIPSEHTV